MDPSSVGNVFDYAFSVLLSPLGMAAAVVGVFVAIAALMSRGWCWALLVLALWTSTFAIAGNQQRESALYWAPLQIIAMNSRLLATAAFLCLLFPSMFAPRGWRGRLIAGAAFAFLALEFIYSGRLLLAGLTIRALSSFGIYLMMFIVLSRGIGAWLQEANHVVAVFRTIAAAGMILVVTNGLQLVIDSSAAIWAGRLHGTSGNSQLMARDLATFLPAILFILLRKDEPKLNRVCAAGTLGLLVVMLAMTGSRTGALMAVVSLIVMFRRTLGSFLKVAVVGCVATSLALLLFPDVSVQTDRFTSTLDTRSEAWNVLVSEFTSSPLYGYVSTEPEIRESSYLSIAARMGVIGVASVVILLVLTFRALRDVRRARPFLGEYSKVADAAAASLASLGIGGLTEGYMLGTLTLQVYVIYLDLAILMFLVDLVSQSPPEGTAHEEHYQPVIESIPHEIYDF